MGINVAVAPPTPTHPPPSETLASQLVIDKVATDPETITAGEPFTLTFEVRNTGTGAARRTLVTVSSGK